MSDIQLLLIEPDERTAHVIAQILRDRWQGNLNITPCGSADEALRILGRAMFDAVLATVPGPPDAAIRTIAELVQTSGLPVLAMGDVAEREIGLAAIRAGAEDYLLKQEALYPALPRILQYAIERRTLSERYRVMGDRRNEIESLLSGVLGVIGSAVAIIDQQGRVVAVNPALTNAFGWTMRDLAGRPFSDFTTPAQGDRPAQVRHKDRTVRPVRLSSTTVGINGRPCQVFAYEPLDGAPHAGGPISFEQRFSALVKSQPERLVAGSRS